MTDNKKSDAVEASRSPTGYADGGLRLDTLPHEERRKYCYCQVDQSHCGTCSCGKPGHLRALMFCTAVWCDYCYIEAMKRIDA